MVANWISFRYGGLRDSNHAFIIIEKTEIAKNLQFKVFITEIKSEDPFGPTYAFHKPNAEFSKETETSKMVIWKKKTSSYQSTGMLITHDTIIIKGFIQTQERRIEFDKRVIIPIEESPTFEIIPRTPQPLVITKIDFSGKIYTTPDLKIQIKNPSNDEIKLIPEYLQTEISQDISFKKGSIIKGLRFTVTKIECDSPVVPPNTTVTTALQIEIKSEKLSDIFNALESLGLSVLYLKIYSIHDESNYLIFKLELPDKISDIVPNLNSQNTLLLDTINWEDISFFVPFIQATPYNPLFEEIQFVGREKEIEEILQFLISNSKSICLITGDPGTGKSELMYEVGRRMFDRFFFIQLKRLNIEVLHKNQQEFHKDISSKIQNELLSLVSKAKHLNKQLVLLVDDLVYYPSKIIEKLISSTHNTKEVTYKLIANYRDVFAEKIVDDVFDRIYFSKAFVTHIILSMMSKQDYIQILMKLQETYSQIKIDEFLKNIPPDCTIREFYYRLYLHINYSGIEAYATLDKVLDIVIKRKYWRDLELTAKMAKNLSFDNFLFIIAFSLFSNGLKLNARWFNVLSKFREKLLKYYFPSMQINSEPLLKIQDFHHYVSKLVSLRIFRSAIFQSEYNNEEYYIFDLDDTIKARLLQLLLDLAESGSNDIFPFTFTSETLPFLFDALYSLSLSLTSSAYQLFEHKKYKQTSYLLTNYLKWIVSNIETIKHIPGNISATIRRINVLSPFKVSMSWQLFERLVNCSNADENANEINILFETLVSQKDFQEVLSEKPPKRLIEIIFSFNNIFSILILLNTIVHIDYNSAKTLFQTPEFKEVLIKKITEEAKDFTAINFHFALVRLLKITAFCDASLAQEVNEVLTKIEKKRKELLQSKKALEAIFNNLTERQKDEFLELMWNLDFQTRDVQELFAGILLVDYVKNEKELEEISEYVSLKISVPFDMSSLCFSSPKNILTPKKNCIKNPILLFQCVCNTPHLKTDVDHCDLHSLPDAAIIEQLFGTNINIIEYDQIPIYWISALTRWPPSIESMIFCQSLVRNGYDKKVINNVLDIGCGTGVLGTYLAIKNPYVSSVAFADIDPSAVKLATFNLRQNLFGKRRNVKITQYYGNGFRPLNLLLNNKKEKPFDLILCSPPYIPMFNRLLPLASPAEGTGLLEEVVSYFSLYADELVLGISHLAEPDLLHAIELTKIRRGIKLTKKPLNGKNGISVPLRIPFLEEDHLQELVEKRKLATEPPSLEHREFKYWHKIIIYSLKAA